MDRREIEGIINSALAGTHNVPVRVYRTDGDTSTERYSRVPVVGDEIVNGMPHKKKASSVLRVRQYAFPYPDGDWIDAVRADVYVNSLKSAASKFSATTVAIGGAALLGLLGGAYYLYASSMPSSAPLASGQGLVKLAEGVLIKGSAAPIYVVQGGKLRWVPSPEILGALGLASAPAQVITDAAMASLPVGTPMIPDGTLVKGGADPIYAVQGGKKSWVPDPATLQATFPGQPVRVIPDNALAALPTGTPIPRVVAPVPAAVVPASPTPTAPASSGPNPTQILQGAAAAANAASPLISGLTGGQSPLAGVTGGQSPLAGLGQSLSNLGSGSSGGSSGGMPDLDFGKMAGS